MIQDYPISARPTWQILGREILSLTAAGLLYPAGIKPSRRRTARAASERTIVLIHGYLGNRSNLLALRVYLRSRGYRQILDFNYPSSAGIEQSAIQLKEFLRKRVRGGRIDLVCHSLGGLVARCYIQELGGARRVDRCITLGTPHLGTYNAYWISSRIGRELRPDSALLKRLAESGKQAASVAFTSLVGGSDNIVIPRVFSANEKTLHLPDVGHIGILFSLQSFRMVADALAEERVCSDARSLFPSFAL